MYITSDNIRTGIPVGGVGHTIRGGGLIMYRISTNLDMGELCIGTSRWAYSSGGGG